MNNPDRSAITKKARARWFHFRCVYLCTACRKYIMDDQEKPKECPFCHATMDLNEGGETMSEYISRNEAMQAVFDVDCHSDEHIRIRNEAMTAIECIPAADVAPVVRGEWVPLKNPTAGATFICSICKRPLLGYPREAAPHCLCGARMKAQEDDHA